MLTGETLHEVFESIKPYMPNWSELSPEYKKHSNDIASALNEQLHLEEMTQLLKDYRERLGWLYDILACTDLAPNDLHLVSEQLEKRGEALGLWRRCEHCQLLECICDEKGQR